MLKVKALTAIQDEYKPLFVAFGIWSFITLCRPQDYVPYLALLKPSLLFGLITLCVYITNYQTHKDILQDKQFKQFLVLLTLMTIGIPFSYYRSASLRDIFDYASVGMLYFFLFYQTITTKEKLMSLLFVLCCGNSLYSLYALLSGKLYGGRIAFGTMFDPNDLAFFIINFFTLNLLFLTKVTKAKRIIAIFNIVLCLIVLFKTGSRGGLVSCLTLFAYLLFVKTKILNLTKFSKAILIGLAFALLWNISMNSERYKTILEVSTDYNVIGDTGRIAIWKSGLRMMLAHPLTGVGMGRFPDGVGRDRQERGLSSARWQVAHNSFIQIGAEIGVVALLIFTLMTLRVFTITSLIKKRSRSEDLVKISEMVKLGFVGHIVCAMFLSQAYSLYWIFYIAMSSKLRQLFDEESA